MVNDWCPIDYTNSHYQSYSLNEAKLFFNSQSFDFDPKQDGNPLLKFYQQCLTYKISHMFEHFTKYLKNIKDYSNPDVMGIKCIYCEKNMNYYIAQPHMDHNCGKNLIICRKISGAGDSCLKLASHNDQCVFNATLSTYQINMKLSDYYTQLENGALCDELVSTEKQVVKANIYERNCGRLKKAIYCSVCSHTFHSFVREKKRRSSGKSKWLSSHENARVSLRTHLRSSIFHWKKQFLIDAPFPIFAKSMLHPQSEIIVDLKFNTWYCRLCQSSFLRKQYYWHLLSVSHRSSYKVKNYIRKNWEDYKKNSLLTTLGGVKNDTSIPIGRDHFFSKEPMQKP